MHRILIHSITGIIIISSILYLGFLPTSDEGLHLYNSYRMYKQSLIYKDFESYLMPLTYYIGAIAFNIYGDEILSPRLVILLLNIFTIYIYLQYLTRLGLKNGDRIALLVVYVVCVFPVGYVYSHHTIDNFLFIIHQVLHNGVCQMS